MAIYTRADNLASVGTGFEPQRVHNWALELPLDGEENDEVTLSIVDGFLPTRYNDILEIPYGNEVVYAAGKMRWEQGNITLRDWVDKGTLRILLNWQLQVGNPKTGAIGLCSSYKKNGTIRLFGPDTKDGSPTDSASDKIWTIHGAWPLRINPAVNGLDMTTSNQVMIQMVLIFDKASCEGGLLGLNYESIGRETLTAPPV